MYYPFLLCALAGLSTSLGAVFVILGGGINDDKMSFYEGFAAGVMLAVSRFDLIPESYKSYLSYLTRLQGARAVFLLFLCGVAVGFAMSKFCDTFTFKYSSRQSQIIGRTAFLTTLIIVLHNLPEGMLTIFTAAKNARFGLKVSRAVALHNIPEGMAVAGPVLYLSKSKKKAFMQAFWRGMAELFGGFVSYFLLFSFINTAFLNGIMPFIAGIMCQTAIFELVPSSMKISKNIHTICGIISGIIVMSIGIFLF